MVIINTLNLKIPAMKRKSLLCLFLIISVAIHGNIYFKHLGKSDGLSQISVLSICQDELDRMWFGTLEGLNCYDGNQMKTYKPSPDNKDYFGGNEISHIVSDKQGNLFFTSDGKLIRYDLHKDRFLSLPLRTQTLATIPSFIMITTMMIRCHNAASTAGTFLILSFLRRTLR